jgi:hypothetical protein
MIHFYPVVGKGLRHVEPGLEEMAFVFILYKCKICRMLGMFVRGIFTFGSQRKSNVSKTIKCTELMKCLGNYLPCTECDVSGSGNVLHRIFEPPKCASSSNVHPKLNRYTVVMPLYVYTSEQ